MAHNAIERPALGQYVDLGTLYDARSDTFIAQSLLSDLPESAVSLSGNSTSHLQVMSMDTYREKFNNLKIGPELGASFLSEMFDVARAAMYLHDKRRSASIEQASIQYAITTAEERVNFGNPELASYIDLSTIQGSGATHVLAGIWWGAQTIVTAKCHSKDDEDREIVRDLIERTCRQIEDTIRGQERSRGAATARNHAASSLDVAIYSDVLDQVHQTKELHLATDFLLELPRRLAAINDGKGFPQTYSLMPLELLGYMLNNMDVKADAVFASPSATYLEGFTFLFDDIAERQRILSDYHVEMSKHPHCVPQDFLDTIQGCLDNTDFVDKTLRSELGRYLQAVRTKLTQQSDLQRLLEEAKSGLLSFEEITDKAKQCRDKISFVTNLMNTGINYLGYGSDTVEKQLRTYKIADAYVLYFSENIRQKSESWDENYKLLLTIKKRNNSGSTLIVVDCEATNTAKENAHISRFQDGRVVVPDVLEKIQYGKSYVRYIDEEGLEKDDAKKPLRRSAVKIPCPGRNCDRSIAHDWLCQLCNASIEYGAADQCVYCDCGRSNYTNYGFQCKELEHGALFERYERGELLQMLNSLDPMDEVNILIIGETGVGKSTFINAFINYIAYRTLDEALANDSLDFVIPCSFNYQTMDRSDPNSPIVQRKIQVGGDKDEVDGSGGESATQKTMVYPVILDDTVIRLIDTPGIGDTRGVDKDRENMQNILGMLSNFEKLHGILFLLKSNSARLTLMFRFVMEELLTHLHRDAALNMVFGFTNTRISNYMPGDTYTPLDNLLRRHSRVQISLNPRTVYCFDSESFRFLAAEKMGTTMENIQDFRLSWEKSESETKRLIEHFRSLAPHAVRSTLSLNQTRDLILHLTKPMADIMQTIDKTIQVNTDNRNELIDTRLRGDQLRQKLHWDKIELVHHSLQYPRTVCNDVECKEYRDDGEGNKQTIYKSHCHPRCWLEGVPIGTVSVSELMKCAAFHGNENCIKCSHHWENHLHVNHELEERTKTVQDEAIVEQLAKNANDITLKETAIQVLENNIRESDYEYKEIQNAAVRFGVFLQKHSITPYNDAMEEYLTHLIKEEKGKVSAGGRHDRLDNLERHLSEHVEQRKVLKDNISSGSADEELNEAGVEDLVQHLYHLKHWGANLLDIKNKAEADHLAEYREKTYRPGRRTRKSVTQNTSSLSSTVTKGMSWLAGQIKPSPGMLEPRRMSTRVATPYQPRNSNMQMHQKPPVPQVPAHYAPHVPGGYPESDQSSAVAAVQRQIQQQQQHQPRKLQAPQPPPNARLSEAPSYDDSIRRKGKGKSFSDKLLRPFTKRF